MKNHTEKYSYKIYAILFMIIICIITFVSGTQLMDYYVNDTINYNEGNIEGNSKLENDYISNFFAKMQFVNMNGAIRNVFGQREMNGIIKLNNGQLVKPIPEVENEVLSIDADRVEAVSDYLEQNNISFLYVATPYPVSPYDTQMPEGEMDYGNANLDEFLKQLEERNVHYLDLREAINEGDVDWYELFYTTDHHWTTQGGFYAFNKIFDEIKSVQAVAIDEKITTIDNYQLTNYPEWHLGSCGQRTGIYYAGIDDYMLIEPAFETHLCNQETKEEGTFSELLINYEPLQNRNYESRYTYDYVLENAIGHYTNELAWNDKKILILSDSMGIAVNPYFILSFKETKGITVPKELTQDLISEYQPDIVIIMYHPLELEYGHVFDFGI